MHRRTVGLCVADDATFELRVHSVRLPRDERDRAIAKAHMKFEKRKQAPFSPCTHAQTPQARRTGTHSQPRQTARDNFGFCVPLSGCVSRNKRASGSALVRNQDKCGPPHCSIWLLDGARARPALRSCAVLTILSAFNLRRDIWKIRIGLPRISTTDDETR